MITRPSRLRTMRRVRLAVLVLVSSLVGALLITVQAGAAGASSGLSTVRLAVNHRVKDSAGHVWASDRSFVTGGRVTHTSRHITGTRTQSLYRTARVGRFGYRIHVTPGWYRVTLGMAEQVYRKAGQRVFSLTAEGKTRMSWVDASRTGRWHAHSVSTLVRVSDGVLTLGLLPRRHAAAVTNIAVTGYRHISVAPTAPVTHPTTPPASPKPPATGSSTPPVTHPPSPPVTPPTTTPAPSQTNPPSTPPAQPTVTPEQFGARGDGVTDDTAALQRTFDGADGRTVLLPAGHVYAHDDLLHLRTPGLHVSGPGELLATREQESSVWIEADNVVLDGGLLVKTAATTQRWGTWDQMGIRLVGHSGITLRDITVDGAAAAGIYLGGATHGFVLDHVTVRNTRADGIHMTEGSYNGDVVSPTVVNSGDDGVAVVSYKQDGTPCHDITVTSPTVLGTSWGRGLSVVGGTNISETNIDVERTSAAGVYIGAEGNPWYTTAATNVTITGGKIVGANTDTSVDHGAVFVLSGESDVAPSNIVVRSLSVSGTQSSSRDLGVITYGAVPSRVLFSGITITGGPRLAYQGNTPQQAYQLRGIVKNGVPVPDAG